jgi:hypothetical protein
MRNAAVFLVGMLAATPVFAGQAKPSPEQNTLLGALRQPQSADSYRRLFDARSALKQAIDEQSRGQLKWKIVCGMKVIEADPTIDPRMAVTPDTNLKAKPSIRAIEPPTCRAAR